jgi:hypothetical protein
MAKENVSRGQVNSVDIGSRKKPSGCLMPNEMVTISPPQSSKVASEAVLGREANVDMKR